jgi:hypothetical protein
LTIKIIETAGGSWGFGIFGLGILLPLSAYVMFGFAAIVNKEADQRRIFIAAHVVTLIMGSVTLLIFPVYPKFIVIVPVTLAILGIANKRNFKYYLLTMIILALLANVLLLIWEIDFDRSLPLFQLFESSGNTVPEIGVSISNLFGH